jgi:hypothetical protein
MTGSNFDFTYTFLKSTQLMNKLILKHFFFKRKEILDVQDVEIICVECKK